jgi:MFS family permease
LGDRLGQMSLIGLVYLRAPGSTVEIAKILSFTILPVFLIGPLAGVYVDRWDRRRTMYVCDFLSSFLVLIIPLFLFNVRNMLSLYFVVFIVFCVNRFFVPAKLSIVPELVEDKHILAANSLINVTGMIAAVLGFGVSGLIVEWFGPQSGLYLDSLSFLVSGLLIFMIAKKTKGTAKFKEISQEIVEVIRKSVFQELKDGLLYFFKKKDLGFTAGIIFVLWSALGAVYVVAIVFVQTTLHSATKDLGLLIMFLGAGLFLGSVFYGRFGRRVSHYKIIFISLVFSGIMLMAFAVGISRYPHFLFAAGLSFMLGIFIAPIMIASNTIIHNVSENAMMGKIFSSLEIVMHLAFLLFMFLSSWLAKFIPEFMILVSVGGVFSVLGLISLVSHRKIPWLDGEVTA